MPGKYKSPYTYQDIDDLLATAANVKAAVTEAQSWSSGGTGTRPGEESDNAKYWASVARQNAGGDYATLAEAEGLAASAKSEAIAASANKDLSNLTDYQRALYNIGGRPNRNIIINHRMMGTGDPGGFPINQRGQKIYTPDWNQYAFDMWSVEANQELKIEIKDGFVTLTNTSSDKLLQFKQLIPANTLLDGEMYTVSIYAKAISGDVRFQIGMTDPPYTGVCITDPKANDIVSATVDALPQVTSGGWKAMCHLYPGASITIADVKLEKGPIQTLGWKGSDGNVHLFDDVAYGEELSRCQQYYRRMYLTYLRFAHYDGSNARVGIPVQGMRTAPACKIIGTPSVYNVNNWGSVSVNLSISAQPRPDEAKASNSDLVVVTAANAPSADIVCNGLIIEMSSEL